MQEALGGDATAQLHCFGKSTFQFHIFLMQNFLLHAKFTEKSLRSFVWLSVFTERCFGFYSKRVPSKRFFKCSAKPGLHEPQLLVERSVTLVSSIVVERRRCALQVSSVARLQEKKQTRRSTQLAVVVRVNQA